MSDGESARLHFERTARLAKALEARGLAIHWHDYKSFVFGSFRLELGTRDRRWGVAQGLLDPFPVHAAILAP